MGTTAISATCAEFLKVDIVFAGLCIDGGLRRVQAGVICGRKQHVNGA